MKKKITRFVILAMFLLSMTGIASAETFNFSFSFDDGTGYSGPWSVGVRVVCYSGGGSSNWYVDSQINGYPTGGWQPGTVYSCYISGYTLPSPIPLPANFCYLEIRVGEGLYPPYLRANSDWASKSNPVNFKPTPIYCGSF